MPSWRWEGLSWVSGLLGFIQAASPLCFSVPSAPQSFTGDTGVVRTTDSQNTQLFTCCIKSLEAAAAVALPDKAALLGGQHCPAVSGDALSIYNDTGACVSLRERRPSAKAGR